MEGHTSQNHSGSSRSSSRSSSSSSSSSGSSNSSRKNSTEQRRTNAESPSPAPIDTAINDNVFPDSSRSKSAQSLQSNRVHESSIEEDNAQDGSLTNFSESRIAGVVDAHLNEQDNLAPSENSSAAKQLSSGTEPGSPAQGLSGLADTQVERSNSPNVISQNHNATSAVVAHVVNKSSVSSERSPSAESGKTQMSQEKPSKRNVKGFEANDSRGNGSEVFETATADMKLPAPSTSDVPAEQEQFGCSSSISFNSNSAASSPSETRVHDQIYSSNSDENRTTNKQTFRSSGNVYKDTEELYHSDEAKSEIKTASPIPLETPTGLVTSGTTESERISENAAEEKENQLRKRTPSQSSTSSSNEMDELDQQSYHEVSDTQLVSERHLTPDNFSNGRTPTKTLPDASVQQGASSGKSSPKRIESVFAVEQTSADSSNHLQELANVIPATESSDIDAINEKNDQHQLFQPKSVPKERLSSEANLIKQHSSEQLREATLTEQHTVHNSDHEKSSLSHSSSSSSMSLPEVSQDSLPKSATPPPTVEMPHQKSDSFAEGSNADHHSQHSRLGENTVLPEEKRKPSLVRKDSRIDELFLETDNQDRVVPNRRLSTTVRQVLLGQHLPDHLKARHQAGYFLTSVVRLMRVSFCPQHCFQYLFLQFFAAA